MYNKEQLRKELEDCWKAGCNAMLYDLGHTATNHPDKSTYITTRLAAIGDDRELTRMCMAASEKSLAKDWVDDGQEEKGLVPAPETLATPNDLIKSLNWCKNLLSSITAATIAGRDLDFVKHGTTFFEETLNAYQSAKSVLKKYDHLAALPVADGEGRNEKIKKEFSDNKEALLKAAKGVHEKMKSSAVTGGVKEALERISKYEVDDGKLSRDMLYELIDIATKALSEGQPE